jgi:hypothetical protein
MLSFKYRLYWNLHKKKWSLQDRQTGRVAHHVTAYTMYDAKFVVRPAGQAKVRREGKKNVHAFAVGTGGLRDGIATCLSGRPVTYNPYVNDTFVFADTGEPVTEVQAISVYTENGKPKVYAIPKSNVGLTD